jgi:hypothetical protein
MTNSVPANDQTFSRVPERVAFGRGHLVSPEELITSGQKPLSNAPGYQKRSGTRESRVPKGQMVPTESAENEPKGTGENDVYRVELQFIQRESGTHIKLRYRVRFPVEGRRPAKVLGIFKCGDLTDRQIKQTQGKTLPPKVKEALSHGELDYELIEQLLKRPGKGRSAAGRRAAAENWFAGVAQTGFDESDRGCGQAGGGDGDESGRLLDGDVSADQSVTRSSRIQ